MKVKVKKVARQRCLAFGNEYVEDPHKSPECELCREDHPKYAQKCKEETMAKVKIRRKMEAEVKGKAAKAVKAEKEVKETKKVAKAEKKEKKASAGANKWGHRVGSAADAIDQAIMGKGISKRDKVDVTKVAKESKQDIKRVKSHIGHLITKGFLKK